MTLAKALKLKNRLAQKISDLQMDIMSENSARADADRKISVEDLMKELEEAKKELIKLKMAIFVASTPIRENILKLSELKSDISFLRNINTKEGKVPEGGFGSEREVEYSVVYDKLYVRQTIKDKEKEIDDIQEELDKFNHTTEIEI